ncbi:MAG: DUF1553 domain-containing protein [Planctomycetaceae bacterium]
MDRRRCQPRDRGRTNLAAIFGLWVFTVIVLPVEVMAGDFRIAPAEVKLEGNFSQSQLLVTQAGADGQTSEHSDDLTTLATYVSSDPSIAVVQPDGRITAVNNGSASITVTFDTVSHAVNVTVSGVVEKPSIDFMEHIEPIISKLGCNSGACHASQYGKGGLKFSVFSFDPAGDYESMIRDRMQRRINVLEPYESLLVKKPTFAVPHEGGKRLEPGSIGHHVLAAWIASGAPGPRTGAPKVTGLTINPPRTVGEPQRMQQLQVLATYSDGRTKDVTQWARYDSLDASLVTVTTSGLTQTVNRGQAFVMARFEGQATVAQFVIPYAATVDLAGWQNNNFIDQHASEKFRELGLPPSPLCDDATFLRRAFMDAIGSLPSVEEAASFIDSTDPDKRSKLIDRLLGLTGDPQLDIYNDRYTAYWTLKWADLLKNSSMGIGERNMWAFHNWLSESFRTNKPMDRFVRELMEAKGNPLTVGPANFFLTARGPLELGESAAQLLLGVRISCARCHHHPFEKYGQSDYYGFAAFFQRVGNKYIQEKGVLSGESIVIVKMSGEMDAPRIGIVPPTPIDGKPVDHPFDRRIALADWLVEPGNEMFTKCVVNRYMGYLMGRGLVHPIDDMRATNPPSNPALLDALALDFREKKFDLKQLLRTIMISRLYQLSSQPNPSNVTDERFYSHYLVKRLTAEPLLDAVNDVTGSQSKFVNPQIGSLVPAGTRAIELPDAQYSDEFLVTFGKPMRATVCECERTPDENLAQALHTLNGELLAGKIAEPAGRIAKIIEAKKTHEEIVAELYLATLSRRPSSLEMDASREFLSEIGDPTECYQDLLWALINSKSFLFNH